MEKYNLHGLTCAECAVNLEKGLSELDTVSAVSVNVATSTLSIVCQDIEQVKKKMKELEPGVTIESDSASHTKLLFIIGSVCMFCAGLVTREYFHYSPFHWVEYAIFLTAYGLAGRNVLKNAVIHSVQGRFFDENFLMVVATGGALLIHELPEAVGVMLFFSVGEYLEGVSVNRSRSSIKSLVSLRPDFARLHTGETVSPLAVAVGDCIVVKPGERIPLDGEIITGSSTVDTSALTGESIPHRVSPGDTVLAGYINATGVITITVTKPFTESSISRILHLVEDAAARRAEPEKFITKFARVYTPVVVICAVFVGVVPPLVFHYDLYQWVYRALVLLVISCPCALVISIPLGYFGGIGKASKEGILVKGANFLDALTELKAVVFDKTGTLTKGVFAVSEIVPMNGFTADEVLYYAALTETHSNHPIARSIVTYNQNRTKTGVIKDYEEVPARGVKATIDGKQVFVGNDRQLHEEMIDHDTCYVEGTVAHVTVDGVYAGYVLIADEIKEDAYTTIQQLKEKGIEIVMLTGDSKDAAECVAQTLGILRFYCELLPEDKVKKVEELEQDVTGTIAFVGDGINDAPVLARADIGIAMGALGSDAAVETADVVIMTDHLHKVAEAVDIAAKTSRLTWENIALVLGVKGVFIVMGVVGIATMWEAVFADVGVALMAVFNATRILRG